MLTIKPLRMADCQAAGDIVGRNPLWRDKYIYSAEQAARDLLYATSHGDFVIGAFEGDKLRGIAWVLPTGAFGRSPYLRLIAVDTTTQSGGVGADLLNAAEREFAGKAKHFFLLVSDFNARAQKFYARSGYKKVGALPDFVLAGTAEDLWMKVIG